MSKKINRDHAKKKHHLLMENEAIVRIEEAFLVVKRLLNLSYLWTGSINGN